MCLDGLWYHTYVCAVCPPHRFPERNAAGIVIENEDMAFLDALISKDLKASLCQLPTDTLPTAVRVDCKMVDVSPSAVMSAKHGAYDTTVGRGNETHPRIAIQIWLDVLPWIGIAQANTFALLPKRKDVAIRHDRELWYGYIHFFPIERKAQSQIWVLCS